MIKQIKAGDLPACLDVIHKSFQTVADEFGLTSENCPTNGAFMPLTRLENDYKKGDQMYGLYEGDNIVGFVQLVKKENGVFELEKLAVLPEHRHKGYGKQLLRFSAETVSELGRTVIVIGIIEENTRLKDWYTQNGFIHTGTKAFSHLPFTVGFMEMKLCCGTHK
ncbi:MAG TPA: GNAT family N-acetyltransferase [Syntrophomonas sp.]|nr:GNAT family N-acetyltransferase [Syntrophomonas sp.]